MLITEIEKCQQQALRNGDRIALNTYKAIKNELLNCRRDKGHDLVEEDKINVLQRLKNEYEETLRSAGDREDIKRQTNQELSIINSFLPKQLSEDEVKTEVENIINDLNATTMKDMGRVMGEANKRLKGKANSKTIGKIAKELLS